jgi:hypothetical protein
MDGAAAVVDVRAARGMGGVEGTALGMGPGGQTTQSGGLTASLYMGGGLNA